VKAVDGAARVIPKPRQRDVPAKRSSRTHGREVANRAEQEKNETDFDYFSDVALYQGCSDCF